MAQLKPTRSEYTVEQREHAITLARDVGYNAAARRLGIPRSTVKNWVKRFGEPTGEPEPQAEAASTEPAPPDPDEPSKPTSQKRYTPSQKAEILEYAGTHSVLQPGFRTCRHGHSG